MFVYGGLDAVRIPGRFPERRRCARHRRPVGSTPTPSSSCSSTARCRSRRITLARGSSPCSALALAVTRADDAAGHRFWEEHDGAKPADDQFLKNAAMMGGLCWCRARLTRAQVATTRGSRWPRGTRTEHEHRARAWCRAPSRCPPRRPASPTCCAAAPGSGSARSGLAGRAAGTVFAQVPDPVGAPPTPSPGRRSRAPGAVLGLAIEAERRAAAVVDAVADRTAGVGRTVAASPRSCSGRCARSRTGCGTGTRWRAASRPATRRRPSALIPVIVQQVTENVIAQLDFVRIVEQIPVDDIAGAIDVEAIVQRIDLGGVIRESTMSLTMEAVDAVRSQGIALDELDVARVVDKVLFRKQPRDVDDRSERRREGRDPQRAVARRAGPARRVRVAGASARVLDAAVIFAIDFARARSCSAFVRVPASPSEPYEMPQPGPGWERHARSSSIGVVAALVGWSGSGRAPGMARASGCASSAATAAGSRRAARSGGRCSRVADPRARGARRALQQDGTSRSTT